jgi:hypothetical protein
LLKVSYPAELSASQAHDGKKSSRDQPSHFERKSWKVDIPIFKMEARTMFSLSTH